MDEESQKTYDLLLLLIKNNNLEKIEKLLSIVDDQILNENKFELYREAAKHSDSLILKVLLQRNFPNDKNHSMLEIFFTNNAPKTSIINLIETAKNLDVENPSALIVDKIIGESFSSLLLNYINLADETDVEDYPKYKAYIDHYDQVKEFINFMEQLGIRSKILCKSDVSFESFLLDYLDNDQTETIKEIILAMQRIWDECKEDKEIQKHLFIRDNIDPSGPSLLNRVFQLNNQSIMKFITIKAREINTFKMILDDIINDSHENFKIYMNASRGVKQILFDELTLSQIKQFEEECLLRYRMYDKYEVKAVRDIDALDEMSKRDFKKLQNSCLQDIENNVPEKPLGFESRIKDREFFARFLNNPLENAVKRILTQREIHETKATGHILSVLTNLITEYLYESKPEDKYVFSKEQLARILPHKEAILSGDIRGRVLRDILSGTIIVTTLVESKDGESKEEAARPSFASSAAASAIVSSSSSSSSAAISATTGSSSSSSSSSSTDLLVLTSSKVASSANQTAPLIAGATAAHLASSSNVKHARKEPSSSSDETQSKRQRVTEQKDSTISTSSSSSSSTSFATRLEGNLAPAPAPSYDSRPGSHVGKLSQEESRNIGK
jgi:hypothetical protein